MKSLLIKILVILSLVSLGTVGVQRMYPQPVYAENADEKLKRLRSEIEKYEKEITRLQSQASHALENQRFRQQLFELTQTHITFLEKEVTKNNTFLRDLIEQGRIPSDVIKTSGEKPTGND